MRDCAPEAFAELPEVTVNHLNDTARPNPKVLFYLFFSELFHCNMLPPQVAFNLIILFSMPTCFLPPNSVVIINVKVN